MLLLSDYSSVRACFPESGIENAQGVRIVITYYPFGNTDPDCNQD